MTEPVGVILAAGAARRMGEAKQLLPFRNTTVLGAVVAAALDSQLERVVVVLGAHENAIRESVDLSQVEVVVNPDPAQGNLSSLQRAADHAGPGPVLLLMGDMPGISPATIDAHLEAYRTDPKWLVATTYEDGMGHPLVLSAELVASLDQLDGRKPLWELATSEAAAALQVPAPMPVDVDTPGDYDKALERERHE